MKEVLYDSYDVLYSKELIDEVVDKIKDIFRFESVFSFEYVKEKVNVTDKQLSLAIEKLYDEKDIIINKFGSYNYFHVNGNYLVLSENYPDLNLTESINQDQNIINTYYSDNLFFTHRRTIDDFLYIKLSNKIKNKSSNSVEEQSIELENMIIKGDEIPKNLQKYIIKLNYPEKAIDQLTEYLFKSERKKINIHIKVLSQLDYSGNKPVILNTFLTKTAGYRATINTITRDLRILDVNNIKRGFRYANHIEIIIFSYMISNLNKNEDKFFEAEIYGSISNTDEQFRIYYNERKEKSTNKREEIRGRKCMTYDIGKLIEIIFKLKIKDKEIEKSNNLSLKKIKEYLISKDIDLEGKNESYIREFYNWYTKKSKTEICKAIQDELKEKGLIKMI